jgi:hypothetical protein
MEGVYKPILLLDFDGVCHMYRRPCEDAATIPDGHVPGLFEFINEAHKVFDIQVFSDRSNQEGGIAAMNRWFRAEYTAWCLTLAPWEEAAKDINYVLTFPEQKPAAFVALDDRCILFNGKFPSIDQLVNFRPWNVVGQPITLRQIQPLEFLEDIREILASPAPRRAKRVVADVEKMIRDYIQAQQGMDPAENKDASS